MKKRIIMLLLVVMIFSATAIVSGKESKLAVNTITEESIEQLKEYYTTPNGIVMTEQEYNFLKEFYFEQYPDIISKKDFDKLRKSGLLTQKYETNTIDNTKSQSHSTQYKTLRISKACDSYCTISITATWKAVPAIRSYDVIGALLSNVSYLGHDQTIAYSTAGTYYFSNIKTAYNGYGNSVKIPATGTNILVNTVFRTTKGGRVYGSYQHAMQNTTLAVSKMYNFSLNGNGNVFAFYGSATNIYDGMTGVDIYV